MSRFSKMDDIITVIHTADDQRVLYLQSTWNVKIGIKLLLIIYNFAQYKAGGMKTTRDAYNCTAFEALG